MVRIVVAGVVGGLLLFAGGAISHMFLNLESRSFQPVKDEDAARTFIDAQAREPGLYGFPMMNPRFSEMTTDEQTAEWNRVNELYKQGPSAYLIVAPRGEDMMSFVQLGGEALTDILAALLVAFVVFHLSTGCRFPLRWLAVLAIGVAGWLSISTSFALWYRFPWPFVLDGLYVVLIEWALAGLAIALIAVRGQTPSTRTAST